MNYDGGPNGIEPYTLEFHFKDWTGSFSNVIGVAASVVHSWELDDPKAPVKGGNVTISLLNKSGTLPVDEFYSVEDDSVMVIHKWRSQVLFEGFIVQDDCREPMIDYSHPITLSATDNLGLLKDVPFNQAAAIVGSTPDRIVTGVNANSDVLPVSGINVLVIHSITTGALVGDTLVVQGTPGSDGVYTVTNVVVAPTITVIEIAETWPFAIPFANTYTFTFITPYDLSDRLSLAILLRICLTNTSLLLNTDIYATIIEDGETPVRFLETTFENGNDYQTGNNQWKSCYEVLSIILGRLRASVFQSEGVWNIIRRDEHRYYNNAIPGFRYDSKMVFVEEVTFDDVFLSAPNVDPTATKPYTWPETGIEKSVIRPFKFVKETFNYKQRITILNSNLSDVGKIILSTTVTIDAGNINNFPYKNYKLSIGDVVRVVNYQFPTYSKWLHLYDDAAFIQVVTQIFFGGAELELGRYVYQPKITNGFPPGYENFANVQFNDIEVEGGDIFDFELGIKVNEPPGGGVTYRFGFFLQVAVGEYYQLVNAAGSGGDEFAWNHFFLTPIQGIGNPLLVNAADAVEFLSYKLSETGAQRKVPPFPTTGLLRIRIYGTTDTNVSQPNVDAIWNNIKITLIALINESTQIIGQTHTDTQQPLIKNLDSVEIFSDDSPRNFLQGTFFLDSFTNLVQNRTFLWTYPFSAITARLGYWTTFEQLFWRRIRRLKMDGAMHGVIQPTTRTLKAVMSFANVDFPPLVSGIYVPAEIAALITAGDVFIISGTVSNNGTYTALSIGTLDTNFVQVTGPLTLEPDVDGFITLSNVPRHISMLTVLKYSGFAGKNFIFGLLSIDHKYNKFDGTFWEQWKEGEVDADLTQSYVFKYLYETK